MLLLGGVIDRKYDGYKLIDQWTSYGWNVFTVDNGNDYGQVVAALKTMEEWDPEDRRPMIVIGKTIKGYWPSAVDGKIPGHGAQIVSYPSHPYGVEDELGLLRRAGEDLSRITTASSSRAFATARSPITRERLIQFKTNMDVVMSLLDHNGLGDWLADRLVEIGDTVKDDTPSSFRRQEQIPSRTTACASRICPWSRKQ